MAHLSNLDFGGPGGLTKSLFWISIVYVLLASLSICTSPKQSVSQNVQGSFSSKMTFCIHIVDMMRINICNMYAYSC